MPYVWFAAICLIWGGSFILMKRAALCLSPIAIGTGRVVFGALVLALVFWGLRSARGFTRKDALPLIGVIVTGFAWPYCIQPALIARHGSAFIAMTVGFTPLLTLGVSAVLLGTRPTVRQTVGVLGALGCLMLLMWDGWQRAIPLGDLLLAVSVPLTYALANTGIRRWLAHVPPIELTVWCLGGASAALLPIALIVPGPPSPTAQEMAVGWVCLLILGVLGTGVATCLFNRLIQEQGPLFAAMVTNLVPLFAIFWGWSDGEVITREQLVAMVGVLSMVLLVQYGAAGMTRQNAPPATPLTATNPSTATTVANSAATPAPEASA